mgnify:CR=1 FL=1
MKAEDGVKGIILHHAILLRLPPMPCPALRDRGPGRPAGYTKVAPSIQFTLLSLGPGSQADALVLPSLAAGGSLAGGRGCLAHVASLAQGLASG